MRIGFPNMLIHVYSLTEQEKITKIIGNRRWVQHSFQHQHAVVMRTYTKPLDRFLTLNRRKSVGRIVDDNIRLHVST